MKICFVFLQCVTTVRGFFLSKTLLLHVQNVVKWTLIKIKNFCFLPGKSGDTQLSRYLNYTRKILTVTVQQLSEKKRQYSDVSS